MLPKKAPTRVPITPVAALTMVAIVVASATVLVAMPQIAAKKHRHCTHSYEDNPKSVPQLCEVSSLWCVSSLGCSRPFG